MTQENLKIYYFCKKHTSMKTKIALSLLTVFAAAILCTSCSNDSNEENSSAHPAQEITGEGTTGALGLTERQAALTGPINDFSLSLFRQASMANEGKSTLLSAVSASFALAMVAEGADADTKEELNATLGVKAADSESLSELLGTIITRSGSLDEETKIEFANCVVLNADYSPTEAFTQRMNSIYCAQVLPMDFSQSETLSRINDWCRKQSHGLIPSIADDALELQPFPDAAAMYVLNAISFKGLWTETFDKRNTVGGEFYDGREWKNVMMMHRTADNAEYCEQEGAKYLRLPFGDGIFNMTFALPDQRDGLSVLLSTLNAKKLKALPFKSRKTSITLPVFTTETNIDLKPLLGAMGIHRIFDPQRSGLQTIFANKGNGMCVSQIRQKARLGVDEEGSEGAAATIAEIMVTSDRDESDKQIARFSADHPFVYIVSERSSGVIYFIGQFCGF